MKYRIGYRTVKTAVGTATSIFLAQLLDLQSFASAGIITILCVQVTKKKSIKASWDRICACIIAMIFSFAFFETIGYYPIVIGLLLLFFIPTVVMVGAANGIVTSSVIILHLYNSQHITFSLLLNETSLIIIGVGVALLVNLYMPSVDYDLTVYQTKIENNFKKIMREMVFYLRTNDSIWDGKEITETVYLLTKGKEVAFRDIENHLLKVEGFYYHYFKMREKQFEILERLLPLTSNFVRRTEQTEKLALFIEELSERIVPQNTGNFYMDKLYVLRDEFDQLTLPETKEEFEERANLLYIIKELEQYLMIKRAFKVQKQKSME